MKTSMSLLLLLFTSVAFAQYPEYRITTDGQYQYLANAGTLVFDETRGTIYMPITIRTFFLEMQDKAYLPAGTSYADFTKLSVEEQRKLVYIPYVASPECSPQQSIPEGCLVYNVNTADHFFDNNAATPAPATNKPASKMSTIELFFHE